MFVGSMSQAISEYLETRSPAKADRVKRNIIALYGDDFHKLESSGMAGALFNAIPGQLSKNVSRYRIGSVLKGVKPGRMPETISEMDDSFAVNIAYHCDDPDIGMAFTQDMGKYKILQELSFPTHHLHVFPVFCRRHAQMDSAVLSEERYAGEVEIMGNFLDRHVGVLQPIDNVLHHKLIDPYKGRLAAFCLAYRGKVFRRDAEL